MPGDESAEEKNRIAALQASSPFKLPALQGSPGFDCGRPPALFHGLMSNSRANFVYVFFWSDRKFPNSAPQKRLINIP